MKGGMSNKTNAPYPASIAKLDNIHHSNVFAGRLVVSAELNRRLLDRH
jgi:hypothetical protein